MVRTVNEGQPLLLVDGLEKHFPVSGSLLRRLVTGERPVVRAVDGVSFSVRNGETLGLVGESGCGKSTAGLALLQLIRPTAGEVRFDGRSIVGLGASERRALRKDMQMILQNPYSSLNPRLRVRDIVGEPLRNFGAPAGTDIPAAIDTLLEQVGLAASAADRYPHEFSGGQRQRISIARSIATRPRIIIADEPVSALDVSVQAQILNLLLELKSHFGLTYVFISHDLAVVRYISDRIAVMYLGELVEIGPAETVQDEPLHPYTEALMAAVPSPEPGSERKRIVLKGGLPSPVSPPPGCRFHPRCRHAMPRCREERPR
jgi:peptide/nickel transport system ATP-binding protein